MTLEMLQKEMIAAMKAGDKVRKDVVSGLVDAVKKATITKEGRVEATEELVGQVLRKEQKTVQEMIDTCPADRTELLESYKAKMAIVNEFAPTLITDATVIAAMIREAAGDVELTKKNRGQVMKVVMPALKGKVDMRVANQVIGGLLV